MDAVSVASSIAGIISLADVVFVRVTKYVRAAKNAEKDIDALSKQVLLLIGAVSSLAKLAQVFDSDGIGDRSVSELRMHQIAACHDTLDEIKRKLSKFEGNGLKRKLVWPFTTEKTKELLADVTRHKENISLALNADSLRSLLRLLSNDKELYKTTGNILEEVKKTREIVTRIDLSSRHSRRREIVDFFLKYNPQQNYEMSLRLRHPRTGLWLTLMPQFQTWLNKPDSRLWLSGIPGAGKTVLAGVVIEEALKKTSDDVATAFFFCDYKNRTTQTPGNILSAISSQLAIQNEEAFALLEKYWAELHGERALQRSASVPELQSLLKDMMKSLQQVHLIVDGLDECGDDTEGVVDALLNIINNSDNISTAFLSRDENNIRERLMSTRDDNSGMEGDIEDDFDRIEIAAHTHDVTEFVTAEIEKRIASRRIHIQDLDLKDEIIEQLISRAKGMFRWVACQLDRLEDCLSDEECRSALHELPSTLGETYKRILLRVPPNKVALVQMMLNFIAYAKPQLEIKLLREALSVPQTVDRNFVLTPGNILREDSITKLCKSLVRKSNDGRFFEFAHFSVQEFLNGELLSCPGLEAFRISESICDQLLTIQCLSYLQLKNFDHWPKHDMSELVYMTTRHEKHPLYVYATRMWPLFARDSWAEDYVADTAISFFGSGNAATFKSWAVQLILGIARELFSKSHMGEVPVWQASVIEMQLTLISKVMHRDFTTLHVAAALSLPTVCLSLLENGADVNRKSPFGCPLQCAIQGSSLASFDELNDSQQFVYSSMDYLEVITTLDVSQRRRSWHPDHFTAETVKCLLHAGATHNVTCSSPFSDKTLISLALWRTGWSKCLLVVSVLIEAGVDITEACLQSFQDAAKRLEEHIDHRRLPSLSAFLSDLKSIIQTLGGRVDKSRVYSEMHDLAWRLALRADCNFALSQHNIDTRILFTEDFLREVLMSASLEGNLGLLGKILEDPRIKDSGFLGPTGKSPLQNVCLDMEAYEALPVCRALIEASQTVEVNPDREGLLPIHHLSQLKLPGKDTYLFEEFGSLVQGLSRQGAGCNSRGPDGRTALHYARSITTAQAILQFDTASNVSKALETTNKDGYTPFSYAIVKERDDIALLFLGRAKGLPGIFQSPIPILALCVQGSTERTYYALVESGVGNCNSNNGVTGRETALHHVTWKTRPNFIRRLISDDPSALTLRIDGNIPLDIFLQSWVSYDNEHNTRIDAGFFMSLVEDLASLRELDASEKALSVESFLMPSIRKIRKMKESKAISIRQKFHIRRIVSFAMDFFFKHGFMESLETVRKRSFVLCILEQAFEEAPSKDWTLENMDPFLPSTICEIILERTGSHFWKTLKVSTFILRLLKAAIRSRNAKLVGLLLTKGVSVHQRCDSPPYSALEVACCVASSGTTGKEIFSLLLDNADKSRINEVNPDDPKKRGLIHLFTGGHSDKSWHISELVQRGADVNLRTGDAWHPTALGLHVSLKSLQTAQELLKHGADPTLQASNGFNAVLFAAWHGMVTLLEELYCMTNSDWKISWETTCQVVMTLQGVKKIVGGANALHICALTGQTECLKFFLDHEILTDVDSVTSVDGCTPLHMAAISGNLAVARLLVDEGAKINSKARDGSLPLHLAVRNQHIAMVKFLVGKDSGADLDDYGMSPASYALRTKNDEITEFLQGAGADSRLHPVSDHIAKELVVAFEEAILDEDLRLCNELLSRGCDPDMELPSECCCGTPLILAIAHDKPKVVQWLLDQNVCTTKHAPTKAQYFAPIDALVRRSSYNHFLPIMLDHLCRDGDCILGHVPSLVSAAVETENDEGLEIILRKAKERGEIDRLKASALDYIHDQPLFDDFHWGDNDFVNAPERAALHWAAVKNNAVAAELLLKYGADLNVMDEDRNTPLLCAAELTSQQFPVANILVRQGAVIDARNKAGVTALLRASSYGDAALVLFLIENGANVDSVSHCGLNFMHYAESKEVFAIGISHCLDPHSKNTFGWTPVHFGLEYSSFASLLLNLDLDFTKSGPLPWETTTGATTFAFLTDQFQMYLKKLGWENFRGLANLEPTDSWSPLCRSASIGGVLTMDNLIRLGAVLDFEGCPSGSALMIACSASRLESVKSLVRNGASICYHGPKGVRSAVTAAAHCDAIVAWLLVGRFVEQPKLAGHGGTEPVGNDTYTSEARQGIGPIKAELVITGDLQRRADESAKDYWFRLMAAKKSWRGKVVPSGGGARTWRPSKLIPEEHVRICPGDYGTPADGNMDSSGAVSVGDVDSE